MLKLCDLKDASQSVWLVAPKVTIGRAANCDLTISDESVSKLHAEVIVEGDELTLHDLVGNSLLLLNGEVVQGSCRIRVNDQLKIGGHTLKVLDPKLTKLKAGAPASGVAWALRANHPAIAGRVFPVRETSVVGRSDDCDITFSLSHLSRRHARLEVREGLLFVADLGSANGTYLNNRRVVETRVRRGDELRFDTLSFSVVGPADDLDKTTVRPAVAVPPAFPAPSVGVASLDVSGKPPLVSTSELAQGRHMQGGNGELAETGSAGWIWLVGLLLVGSGAAFYWARSQGLI